MTPTPPDIQKIAILGFLEYALRGDKDLLHYLGGPEGVLQSTIGRPFLEEVNDRKEDNPDNDVIDLYLGELPCLAAWRGEGKWTKTKGDAFGNQTRISLAYLFRPPGNAAIDGKDWANRVAWMVWRKLCAYLRHPRVDGWGVSGDLRTDGWIEGIECDEMFMFDFSAAGLYGFQAAVKVAEVKPSWPRGDHPDLKKIHGDLYRDTVSGTPLMGHDVNF